MFTAAFWTAAFERAAKTAAQSALVVLVVGDQMLNAFDADWGNVGGIALGGAIVSVLTSVASGAINNGNASLTHVENVDGRHEA